MNSPVVDAVGRTPRWLIEDVIAGKYLVDLGIVQSTDQSTVDVQHAVIRKAYGTPLGPTVTKGLEVVWAFPGSWTLAAGDIVLLLGMKDYVKTAHVSAPAETDVGWSYTQETMKAVPLYSSKHKAQITIDGSDLVHIKNAAASLFTVLNTLVTDLSTFATACEASGTDPTLVTAATVLAGSLVNVSSSLAQILAA